MNLLSFTSFKHKLLVLFPLSCVMLIFFVYILVFIIISFFLYFLQGICSAYDVILVCDVDPLKLFSLRKTEKSNKVKGHNKETGETEDDRENETNDYDRNGEIKSKGQSDGAIQVSNELCFNFS